MAEYKDIVEAVRYITNSQAWTDFYVPLLLGLRAGAVTELIRPDEERRKQSPDDYLRGQIDALDALLSVGSNIVAEFDAAIAQREAAAEEAAGYQDRADLGHPGPIA